MLGDTQAGKQGVIWVPGRGQQGASVLWAEIAPALPSLSNSVLIYVLVTIPLWHPMPCSMVQQLPVTAETDNTPMAMGGTKDRC